MNLQELYRQAVKPLPASERLRLAAMILNDIPPQSIVDYSEQWSDEDLSDFTRGAGSARKSKWGMQGMPRAGDVVTVDFQGATGVKRRPAVVVSSDLYHAHRPT